MSATPKLSPCPFCGCPGPSIEDSDDADRHFWVECPNCYGEGPGWRTVGEAVAAWNRRAGSPPPAVPDLCALCRFDKPAVWLPMHFGGTVSVCQKCAWDLGLGQAEEPAVPPVTAQDVVAISTAEIATRENTRALEACTSAVLALVKQNERATLEVTSLSAEVRLTCRHCGFLSGVHSLACPAHPAVAGRGEEAPAWPQEGL